LRRLIWSNAARRDLYQIADTYDAVEPGLGLTLLERVEEAPLLLLDYPGLGSATALPGIRKWPVRKTPFLLFYAATRDRVEIIMVRHAASDWRSAQ
jgi:plasmid stabilization system protein ParE